MTGGESYQEVLKHAREMVEGHYPSHREYKVARALLDMEERWKRLRWCSSGCKGEGDSNGSGDFFSNWGW